MARTALRAAISHRFLPVWLFGAVLVALATSTRVALTIVSASCWAWSDLPRIFATGLVYDLAAAGYAVLPLALYCWIVPDRAFRSRWHAPLPHLLVGCSVFALAFLAAAEWLFWDEFQSRFNFIAVDYLVYTREVLGNIWQSYPVARILAGLALASLALAWAMRSVIERSRRARAPFAARTAVLVLLAAFSIATTLFLDHRVKERGANAIAGQLAGNGLYEFAAAFRNNELDYERFYATEVDDEVFAELRRHVLTPEARYVGGDARSIEREIRHEGPERRLNVVLVSGESLSAEFMAAFGNTQGLTPNLDRLAAESLFFTRVYATGTRTVRGLEALSLCVPPLPGQSIVKRPGAKNLFTLGHVFRAKGYDTRFIYGGYGWFDNMNAFFSANGYDVVDRTSIPAEEIHHETIWGVADEDLFTRAIAELDASHAAGRTFFAHVMTTSNHRPFTYPEGRIDIPSGSGREGAVKYADYALGRFIAQARTRPWFDDTVFVLTADHTHNARGRSELPIEKYHIPLLMYAPAHIAAQRFERPMSQIDIGPTLLGRLNFSYVTRFFGVDMFELPAGEGRAYFGNYQTVGYAEAGRLIELYPRRVVRVVQRPDFIDPSGPHEESDEELRADAISFYQGASTLLHRGGMSVPPTMHALQRILRRGTNTGS